MNQPDAAKTNVDSDTFLLKREHSPFVLGKSKYLNPNGALGTGCITLFFSVFVLFGTMFLVITLRDLYEWFIISQSGVANSAQYIGRRIASSDDSDTYFVSFKYMHNDREYSREQRVSWGVYNSAELGGRVNILYVPFNPQVARVAGTNSAPTGMLLFAIVWNAFVYLIVFFALRQYRRMKFLERSGRILPGQIMRATSSTDSDGDLTLKIEYAFYVAESKRRFTHTEQAQRNDLKGKSLPAVGTPVAVLYYDERRYMLL